MYMCVKFNEALFPSELLLAFQDSDTVKLV